MSDAAVAVAVPPDLQPVIARRALELGKPVFLEKPLSADLGGAQPVDRLRGREKKKGSFLGKLLVLSLVGAIAALVLSEDLRKAVLDRLFGAEEEFEYTSTTNTATTAS